MSKSESAIGPHSVGSLPPVVHERLKDPDRPDLGICMDAEWHDWEVTHTRDMLSLMNRAKEAIESLPETRATFAIPDILDGVRAGNVPSEVVEVHGAWPVPETLSPGGSYNHRSFVNPNYRHAQSYSECIVRCDCGAVMARQNDFGNVPIQGEHEHTDDCPRYSRIIARGRLSKKRAEVIERALLLGHTGREIRDRIGISSESVGSYATANCLSISDLRDRSNVLFARTWVRLLLVYSPEAIGDAHGITGRTVCRWVEEKTDAEISDFYSYRRKHGSGTL